MKKNLLLVAIGLVFLNGCANKTATIKPVTPKANMSLSPDSYPSVGVFHKTP